MSTEATKRAIKKWQLKNREKVLEYKRINRSRKSKQSLLFESAQRRAKECSREFSITLEDIVIPEFCPYLGIKMDKPSLDRIDTSKGYIPGNVQVISFKANTMKSNASINELITFAENILKLHK